MNHQAQPEDQVQQDADKIINSITNCVERGEIEPGIKRGTCHVFLDHSNRCACGDVTLKNGSGKRKDG